MRGCKAIMAAATVMLLAACETTSVNPAFVSPRYTRAMVIDAANSGAMPTVVHGRATPALNEPTTANVIVQRVRLPGWSQVRSLKLAPAGARLRLVYIVNPNAVGAAMNGACGPLQGIPTNSGGERIVVAGAFCNGERVMTRTSGTVPVGRDDAVALTDLTQQITLGLLPAENRMSPTGRVWDRWWP